MLAAVGPCSVPRRSARHAINVGPAATSEVVVEADPEPDASADADHDEDAGNDVRTGAATLDCIGDQDSEPDCMASRCRIECATIVKPRFKKGIANQILGCMEMYPSCESVSSCIIERGTHDPDAGRAICEDPTATVYCRPLVDGCSKNGGAEITMDSCVAMAKILTPAGLRELAACVTKGKAGECAYDSSSCLDAMRD
jgi:hypothetical protein